LGYLSDIIRRKRALVIVYLIHTIATACFALSPRRQIHHLRHIFGLTA
jgi:hypothetical protein